MVLQGKIGKEGRESRADSSRVKQQCNGMVVCCGWNLRSHYSSVH